MSHGETALVVGMNGGFGGATARALRAQGFRIRGLSRGPAPTPEPGIEWLRGDAMNRDDLRSAARGATVIVHGAHPAGYRNWREHGLPMLDNVIAAAKHAGATVVFPGNVYNFGPDAGEVLREDSPQHPRTRKGSIRVGMEQTLRDAGRDGVRSLVLRCGDFFGPGARSSWFSQALVKPGRAVRRVAYPGAHSAGHSWAYLPDAGRAVAELMRHRRDFAPFEVFHFAGHWLPRGVAMAETICEVAGIPRARIGSFPWWAIIALSPFAKTFGEMLEMRYLWTESLALDNRKLVGVLGREPHTPLRDAVEGALASLGCLEVRAAAVSSAG